MLENIIRSERVRQLQAALTTPDLLLIEELWNAPKALVAALISKATNKHVLIVTAPSREEAGIYHDFAAFTSVPVVDFPAWETLPSENAAPSPDIVGERYSILKEVIDSKAPQIILTNLQACLQKLISPEHFVGLSLYLEKGKCPSFDALTLQLLAAGYERKPVVTDKGQFAVRGGIIDIFPVSSPDPYRLEFWGDDLETLRLFDPIGQKSIRKVERAVISPGLELELLAKEAKLATLFDYLGKETVVILDDIALLEDKYAGLIGQGGLNPSFCTLDDFFEEIAPLQKMFWTDQPVEKLGEVRYLGSKTTSFYSQATPFHDLSFEMFNREWKVKRWNHPFNTVRGYLFDEQEGEPNADELLARLSERMQQDGELFVLSGNELEKELFYKRLAEKGIAFPPHSKDVLGYLSSGLVVQDNHTVLFPLTELTHRTKIRRQKQRSTYHTTPADSFDLTPGEMVVHFNNGIGRFLGIERRPNHLGHLSEFFILEYAENSKLFVPLNQAHLITKYIGANEVVPKLSELGSNRWKKTKENTERAVLGYAADMLKSYAMRTVATGVCFPEDSDDQMAFEDEFPFTETEDQLQAVSDIKADMMSTKVMDRLVCGDVGYGKTEVAMRAAFKAVTGGKQVAVLVPTTVLAMQHFETFVARMAHFPVTIAVLSRFRTKKECKEAIEGLANGSVDIIIGTHRLISDDVKFKDLGLVIIDEEQRFGVKAKEHLKKIKIGVDCLTLSATPIPRTLYMSLIGARDMSVINTPPQDRLPIKTIITEPTDAVLQSALLRELARDGQAYVIHNRVESIFDVASRIKKLLPQARIIVAHGQMHADEIDTAFHAFKSGLADILIATTIVENGIDIPNANTILIDKADHFGLATLYQLRGRVGRWNRRAFAYFLVSNFNAMPEFSRKRLQALAEAGGYGGGMKVAMRDLELRGAGDILGTEQSGNVSSIGFHLYCKMLKRAVGALQGKIPSIVADTKVELAIDARFPEDYIDEVSLRMEFYHRLGEALSWEEVDALWEEITDRFGLPPIEAEWLYHMTRIRVYAALHGITLIKQEKVSLTIEKQRGKSQGQGKEKEKDVEIRRLLCPKFASPKEMEERLLKEMG